MTNARLYRCASIDIGVVNLALCVTEFSEKNDGTFEFSLEHVERCTIGRMRDTIHVLGKKLLAFYTTNDALNGDKMDYVFIEQQLSRASKNIALAHITMAYFETRNFCCDGEDAKVVFVSPKNKFKAVRVAFPAGFFDSVDFERHGRALKKQSVDIARFLFTRYNVTAGLKALEEYKAKPDDVSDVFLQSFAFFLEKFPLLRLTRERSGTVSFIGVEEHGQREDADKQAK